MAAKHCLRGPSPQLEVTLTSPRAGGGGGGLLQSLDLSIVAATLPAAFFGKCRQQVVPSAEAEALAAMVFAVTVKTMANADEVLALPVVANAAAWTGSSEIKLSLNEQITQHVILGMHGGIVSSSNCEDFCSTCRNPKLLISV